MPPLDPRQDRRLKCSTKRTEAWISTTLQMGRSAAAEQLGAKPNPGRPIYLRLIRATIVADADPRRDERGDRN